MNYLIILVFVTIIMGIALVATLLITKEKDKEYSGVKSINDQVWLYIASIPVLIIIGLLFWLYN